MTAFAGTPTSAEPYASQVSGDLAPGLEVSGDMRIAFFDYTHSAGAGTGEVNLVTLPAGRIVIFSDLSRIVASQMATSADLHLGYRAHTTQAGVTVNEDDNAFLNDSDVASAAVDAAFVLPAGGFIELNSKEGITIFALIDSGNIEDTDTISGWVAYAKA